MTSIITHGATVITPVEIEGYTSRRNSGNLAHPVLGSEETGVTYRPAKRRRGTLTLMFSDEVDSKAAEDEHTETGTFALTNAETSTIEMTYVVLGGIERDFAPSEGLWRVTVDYLEVPA